MNGLRGYNVAFDGETLTAESVSPSQGRLTPEDPRSQGRILAGGDLLCCACGRRYNRPALYSEEVKNPLGTRPDLQPDLQHRRDSGTATLARLRHGNVGATPARQALRRPSPPLGSGGLASLRNRLRLRGGVGLLGLPGLRHCQRHRPA